MGSTLLRDQRAAIRRARDGRDAEGAVVHRTPEKSTALILTPWYGGDSNGVGIAVESLAHSLIAAGRSCVIVQVVGDGWLPRFRRGERGETIVLLCLRPPLKSGRFICWLGARWRLTSAALTLRYLVRARGLGVAHFHYTAPEYSDLQRICARSELRMLATFHGSDLTVNLNDPNTMAATTDLLAACAVSTTVSGALRDMLLRTYPELADTCHVVHNSVPTRFFEAATSHAPQSRDLDVLFVGNLCHRKGTDVLIRAIASARCAGRDVRLTVAGDGAERQQLEELARQCGVADLVQFVGRQSRAALVGLNLRAKVVAVPSRSEPFGLVVVEAQLCGAAVVASAVGGIPEIVLNDSTGLLVPPDEPDTLKLRMLNLLDDAELRTTLAERGRRRAISDFSPAAIARKYIALYDGVRSSAM